MFEEELELEKQSSNIGPMIMIAALVLILVGGVGFMIFQSKRTLKPEDAAKVITQNLQARGPATTSFQTGSLGWSEANESHYLVLEKAGLVSVGKPDKNAHKPVKLTADGEKAIAAFPEFAPQKDKDGTATYKLPLATRKLVKVNTVTMQTPSVAIVEYTWKWEPNKMGEIFDASGKQMQALSSWQRASVIQKHGGDYYSELKTMKVRIVNGSKGWQVATE